MRLTLSGGKAVRVGVSHTKPVPVDRGERATVVWFKDEDGNTLSSVALCSPRDNFCKRVGRRLAANRLLAALRDLNLPKPDRRAVFLAICPEYQSSAGGKA